jgi:hypothetical protein
MNVPATSDAGVSLSTVLKGASGHIDVTRSMLVAIADAMERSRPDAVPRRLGRAHPQSARIRAPDMAPGPFCSTSVPQVLAMNYRARWMGRVAALTGNTAMESWHPLVPKNVLD